MQDLPEVRRYLEQFKRLVELARVGELKSASFRFLVDVPDRPTDAAERSRL
jgi:hypothetical protein